MAVFQKNQAGVLRLQPIKSRAVPSRMQKAEHLGCFPHTGLHLSGETVILPATAITAGGKTSNCWSMHLKAYRFCGVDAHRLTGGTTGTKKALLHYDGLVSLCWKRHRAVYCCITGTAAGAGRKGAAGRMRTPPGRLQSTRQKWQNISKAGSTSGSPMSLPVS